MHPKEGGDTPRTFRLRDALSLSLSLSLFFSAFDHSQILEIVKPRTFLILFFLAASPCIFGVICIYFFVLEICL